MRLFLHIGAPKCGSTSIQEFISANQVELTQAGIMPLTVWGNREHWKLPVATGSNDVRKYWVEEHKILSPIEFDSIGKDLWEETEQFVSMAQRSGVYGFVASSERLYAQVKSQSDIDYLASKLRVIFSEIFVIFYCRDQAIYARSVWAQLVKGPQRETRSLQRYLQSLDSSSTLNFYKYLCKWRNAFGSGAIKANVLVKENLIQGDLIYDFLSCIGLSETDFPIQAKRSNISPGFLTLEMLRRRNQLASASPAAARRWFDRFVSALLWVIKVRDISKIPDHLDDSVRDIYRTSNVKFNHEFLNARRVKLPGSATASVIRSALG